MVTSDELNRKVTRLEDAVPLETTGSFQLEAEKLVPRMDLLSKVERAKLKAFVSNINAKYPGCADIRYLLMELTDQELHEFGAWRQRGKMLELTK